MIFQVKSFLGNFYRHLATFYWSHCPEASNDRRDVGKVEIDCHQSAVVVGAVRVLIVLLDDPLAHLIGVKDGRLADVLKSNQSISISVRATQKNIYIDWEQTISEFLLFLPAK